MKFAPVEIAYLADHPEWVPTLATWFFEEWGRKNPASSCERAAESIRARLNRDRLPLALVAIQDSEPIGSASLKIQEMDTHKHLLHWLGTVYVRPGYRRQGIGSQLVEHAVRAAQSLGLTDLFLYTRHQEGLYARLGWTSIERTYYHGKNVVIMKREVVPSVP